MPAGVLNQVRRLLVFLVTLSTACGAAPPPGTRPAAAAPPVAVAPRPVAPVMDSDLLPAPEPVSLPVDVDETARPTRVQYVATLRPAMGRCTQRHDGLTPGFAGCACDVLCRARFPVEDGTTTIRYPFVDVDGLVFTIEPDGRVSSCAYSVGGRTLADVTCGEDD